ncbi:Uncharacterised protein [uncultured archaeon]|nr:Uncharacterised protein [uncultured archaeon]
MADGHVYVGPAPYPWSDIVDVEVQVFVHAGLQAEGPYDSRSVILLSGINVLLGQLEGLLKKRLAQRGRIVAAYCVFGVDLLLVQGHLLGCRQSDVPIQARLETPVYANQLYSLGDGRVKEVKVEHRTDDVPLNPCQIQAVLVNHSLLQKDVSLLTVLFIGGGREKPALKGFDCMRQLYHDQLIDLLRFDLLREGQPRFFQQPVIIPLVAPLLRPEKVPGTYQRNGELVLYGIYPAVRGEGPIGNEEDVL